MLMKNNLVCDSQPLIALNLPREWIDRADEGKMDNGGVRFLQAYPKYQIQ
jgi:hypothetical protein